MGCKETDDAVAGHQARGDFKSGFDVQGYGLSGFQKPSWTGVEHFFLSLA